MAHTDDDLYNNRKMKSDELAAFPLRGMHILGFNCYKHDASAALIRNGEVLAAVEEERFTGVKHTSAFPEHAIAYCLDSAGIGVSDLDYVCFYWDPTEFLLGRVLLDGVRLYPNVRVLGPLRNYFLFRAVRQRFFSKFPSDRSRPKFVYINHHAAHAASACYPSGFNEAAVLVADGAGERATLTLYAWTGNRFSRLRQVRYPYSLGFFYSAVTDFLGFQTNNDEYKIMGLSAYGKPKYLDRFREMIWGTGDGGFGMDLTYFHYQRRKTPEERWFSDKFVERFGPPRVPGAQMNQHYADIAASAQAVLEEVLLEIARYLNRRTGFDCLAVAGGVGLNCLANGRLLREAGFREVFFQPAAADMGTSVGVCLYQYHSIAGASDPAPLRHLYTGPEYSTDRIEETLIRAKVRYRLPEDLEGQVAAHLARGRIVGWFQGRIEFGPRALGARSILADPRVPEMKDILNAAVKFREEFRPFAPSVVVEEARRFFEIDRPAPYMIVVHNVRPEVRSLIPAVTHVDGTARVHTVSKDVNPRYYRLLRRFEALTGIPMVVNTSFNIKGQPIVCTPEDALGTFFTSGLDVLAIGDFLVEK